MPARSELQFHPPLPDRGVLLDKLSPEEAYEMRNLTSFWYLALRVITPPDGKTGGSSVLLTPDGVQAVESALKAAELFPAEVNLSRVEHHYVHTPTVDGNQFDFIAAEQETPVLSLLLFDAEPQRSGTYYGQDYRITAHVHRPANPSPEIRTTTQALINTFEKTHNNKPRIAAVTSVIAQIGRRQASWG